MSDYLNFERELNDKSIRNAKKDIFIDLTILSLCVLAMVLLLPKIIHFTLTVSDGIGIGIAVSNAIFMLFAIVGEFIEYKYLINKKSIYEEFDVKEKMNRDNPVSFPLTNY